MAAITTNAAGAWSSTGTWVGGVIPGNGDTVTINHAVTVTDSRIVGTSPAAGTVVLAINAALTVNNGGTLRVRGDSVVANVAFTVDQGGSLIFDASLAASPSTTAYTCTIGTANGQASSYFKTTGVTGNVASVSSDSGGAHGYFKGGGDWARGGKAICAFCDFTRIGDDTNNSFNVDLSSGADSFTFDDCVFTSCAGPTTVGSAADGTTFRFKRTSFKNSSTVKLWHAGSSDTITSGERAVTFSVFDQQPQFYAPGNFTIEDNTFYICPDFTTKAWASWQRNLVRLPNGFQMLSMATVRDTYFYFDDASGTNPHFLAPDGTAPSHDILNNIFEFNGTDDQGDCWLGPTGLAAARAYTLNGNIILPNASGVQSGTLATLFGDALLTVTIEHNTHWSSGGAPGVSLGESSNAHAGQLASYRGNICRGDAAGTTARKLVNQETTQPGTVDIVPIGMCDFNCGSRTIPGRAGKGIDTTLTYVPGQHDVDVDPLFVDETRNLAKWDLSLGGPGTGAHALAELMKRNDRSGFNASYTLPSLLAYVRAGFTPQNAAILRAAHDNTTIGAVAVSVAPSTPVRRAVAPAQRG